MRAMQSVTVVNISTGTARRKIDRYKIMVRRIKGQTGEIEKEKQYRE